jgi:hypothetical protein
MLRPLQPQRTTVWPAKDAAKFWHPYIGTAHKAI